jgi:hypothetical protein
MRRYPQSIVLAAAFTTLLGCGTSPTAPGPATGAPQFDSAALLASLAGAYTLTIEADDAGCPLPPSMKVLTYDVWLEPGTPHRYLGVRVPGKPFVGNLWALAKEEDGFSMRWNVDCEAPDTIDSAPFYVCGEGPAFAAGGMISGVFGTGNVYLDEHRRSFCTIGAHRFVFQRRS